MQTPSSHLVGGLASTTLDVCSSMQKIKFVGLIEIGNVYIYPNLDPAAASPVAAAAKRCLGGYAPQTPRCGFLAAVDGFAGRASKKFSDEP